MLEAAWRRAHDRLSSLVHRSNLAHAGRDVTIRAGVDIRYPGRIELEDGVQIEPGCVLGSELPSGRLFVGRNTVLGSACSIDFTGGLEIGSDCTISAQVRIYTHDHGLRPRSTPKPRPMRIGNSVWIGTGAIILHNAGELGDCCVVASRAVVTRPVAPYTVVGGNPAKEIGHVPRESEAVSR
jgi:acetyltransferase-like isoleucine patch superfamily enzyme